MTDRDVRSNVETSPDSLRPTGRTRSPERGLPDETALRELARTYLRVQGELWPEMARDGTLPGVDDARLEGMARKFRACFLGEVAPGTPAGWAGACRPPLACCYLGYSCDHSNPRSLDQQLGLVLRSAHEKGHFIPWGLVFADAAVSGTIADRSGYGLAKWAVRLDGIAALYIDEVGRASRDSIEALKLGRTIAHGGKRLIGESDAFDSDLTSSKMMLSMYAMIHEGFVDQLRSKVHRGMDDAFARGTNIHSLPVGYRLVPALDEHGRPILGKDREPLKRKMIDPAEAEFVREAFRLYVEGGRSPGDIARLFNDRRVGDQRAWEDSLVRQLLRRRTYVGIEVYRCTRQVRDPETSKTKVVPRPRGEWSVKRLRHLQIVPLSTWKAAQKKLGASREAWSSRRSADKPSRTQVYPSVLIRPRCGACGADMMFGRSGDYPSFCCLNGIHGKKGCTAKGYKSLRIVEGAILAHLRHELFTPEFLARVVERANHHLAAEATRPKENVEPLKAQIRASQRKRDKLVAVIEGEGTEGLGALLDQMRGHERRIAELRKSLAEIEARNAPAPPPMPRGEVEALLGDLRTVLAGDIPAAASILRDLTGPIVVEQVAEKGVLGVTWLARFTLNAVPALVTLSRARDCPTRRAWEYLNERRWTFGTEETVRLEACRRSHALAAHVRELRARGGEIEAIARALGSSAQTVKSILKDQGKATAPNPAMAPPASPPPREHPYMRIAPQVLEMREAQGLSFKRIGKELGVSPHTASRAYDFVYRESRLAAMERGEVPTRARAKHKTRFDHAGIIARVRAGVEIAEVAREFGCCKATVYLALAKEGIGHEP